VCSAGSAEALSLLATESCAVISSTKKKQRELCSRLIRFGEQRRPCSLVAFWTVGVIKSSGATVYTGTGGSLSTQSQEHSHLPLVLIDEASLFVVSSISSWQPQSLGIYWRDMRLFRDGNMSSGSHFALCRRGSVPRAAVNPLACFQWGAPQPFASRYHPPPTRYGTRLP
jgi:hypothetical protein